MTFPQGIRGLISASLAALLAGCAAGLPKDALRLTPEAAAARELQTRRFDGLSEAALLEAGAGTLQDLGFTIDETESRLGVIVASKQRSAVDDAEVAGAYLLTLMSILMLAPSGPVYAKRQDVRVALVTRPAHEGAGTSTVVRVTFQRVVYDNNGQVLEVEKVDESDLYREFFDRLSQSVFLEALSQ